MGNVHSGFVVEALSGFRVQFSAKESQLGSGLLGSLAGILDLNTGEPEFEVKAEAEVP